MSVHWPRLGAALLTALAAVSSAALAESGAFPTEAGVIDVSKSPYHARGDGRTDDTEALQQALLDHPGSGQIIYLPRGDYLVSNGIHWPEPPLGGNSGGVILEGQSRSETIIRLADYTPGFGNSGRPRAVLWTGERGSANFRNGIRNLTVQVGAGNPGAIGIQFDGNRQAVVRDVNIVSDDGTGVAGLDLALAEQEGPCWIQRLRVKGFGFGVRLGGVAHLVAMEGVDVEGQRTAGLRNAGLTVALRDFQSVNECPGIQNSDSTGVLALVDATLRGLPARKHPPAIYNRGILFARRLSTAGYTNAIENRAGNNDGASGPEVREFVSHPLVSLFSSPQLSLGLPVEVTPDPAPDAAELWRGPGASAGLSGDDGPAIQSAVDSGAGVVFLPHGAWTIRTPVVLRAHVRRVIGCEARVLIRTGGAPAFRFENGDASAVVIERLWVDSQGEPLVEHAAARDLALRDCYGANVRWTGSGDLFLEDVFSTASLTVPSGRRLWARQWFVSTNGRKLINDGGVAWLLGFGGERPGTLIETRAGGRTEALGAYCHSNGPWKLDPMMVIDDASATFVLGETSLESAAFQTIVEERRKGVSRKLGAQGIASEKPLPQRVGGVALPLYTGYSASGPASSPALPAAVDSGK